MTSGCHDGWNGVGWHGCRRKISAARAIGAEGICRPRGCLSNLTSVVGRTGECPGRDDTLVRVSDKIRPRRDDL